jgi:hypothetical protein
MNPNRYTSTVAAVILLLVFATPALANSIAPTAYFWPGVLPLTLGLALPASVLAAVLERPFVCRAGVREHAFWYSLQANLVSLVIGYVTLPIGVYAIYTIGPLWSIVAVGMSIASEGQYYQWRVLKSSELRWSAVIWGNVFSSLILLLLPYAALWIKEAKPSLVWELSPYEEPLFWGSVTGSFIVFILSFGVPRLLGYKNTPAVNEHGVSTFRAATRLFSEGPSVSSQMQERAG